MRYLHGHLRDERNGTSYAKYSLDLGWISKAKALERRDRSIYVTQMAGMSA